MKSGILIINLGTPDRCDVVSVRKYLREFLMDPRVIDIPFWSRWLLVNLIIAPFRGPKSLEAYKKIWGKRGSPLAFHNEDLGHKLSAKLDSNVIVKTAMRYQNPKIEDAIHNLHAEGVSEMTIVPMFPQYSSAAYGSVVEKVNLIISKMWNTVPTRYIKPFYDHPSFIDCLTQKISECTKNVKIDKLLFSYHGLPERHCQKSDLGNHCLTSTSCCDKINDKNVHCYRAQCFATTHAVVKKLGLKDKQWDISFQSRLGKNPWIKPYTDLILDDYVKENHDNVFVVCPAFVSDCLETIEEIGIRAKEQYESQCDGKLTLIPCLNSDDNWVDAVKNMVIPLKVK